MKISKGKSLMLTCLLSSSIILAPNASAASSSSQKAVTLGNELTTQLNEFNRIISSGNIAIINMQYDSLSNKIKQTEAAIGKVSGSSNRRSLLEKYVKNAKIARERVIYEVSQFRFLDKIDREISNGNTSGVSSELAKLKRLKERAKNIKAAGGYSPLPKLISTSLTDWEEDLRSYKNTLKENTVKINEVEPNDDKDSAMAISSGVVINGLLVEGQDDIYSINVESSGEVRVNIHNDDVKFKVYDENGMAVLDSLYRRGEFEAEKGTYYVELYNNRLYREDQVAYQLKVTYPSSKNNQSNDTLQTATNINNGMSYSDTIDTLGDIDYYKLDVKGPGQIEVFKDWNSEDTEITIRNQFGTILESNYLHDEIAFNAESAGTYYITVEEDQNSYSSSKPYRIKVSFPSNKTYFNSEFESNESFANAMPILTNVLYNNNVKNYWDDDIFTVNLKQGDAFLYGDDTAISVYDKYGTLIGKKLSFSSTDKIEIPLNDIYYISVDAEYYPANVKFRIVN
ncbi:hypothetical protein [Metabacillus endolithicus]|uniref:SbsC C-terminal domain-containing protein n=1 Tax=Metabacillus endolithicus TaxID=1535204 RepID=A0ABW5C1W7_9BACI|nr:hypothetical protein [Metabacillus endolithicus]UPG66264.1 hypothetical protein MVE64_26520 [Metabacillus endolithicus]